MRVVVMAQGHRYNKRTESLPSSLPNSLMLGNGQISQEENPNYLVYKKVRGTTNYHIQYMYMYVHKINCLLMANH